MTKTNRTSLLISIAIVGVVLSWLGASRWLVPVFIESVYRGESFSVLNAMISGQADHALAEYLMEWNQIGWQIALILLSIGLLLLVFNRPEVRRLADDKLQMRQCPWNNASKIFLVIVLLLSMATNLVDLYIHGRAGLPPIPGDTQDYDNIAFNLSHGRGFALDFTDTEWREPYLRHNANGLYDDILSRQISFRLTTYRPPAMPALLAGTYVVFGRSFLAWQIVSSAMMATAVTLAVALCLRFAGWGPAVLMVLLAVASQPLRRFSYDFLTESMASLAITMLAWMVVQANERRMIRYAVGVGLMLGLSLLVRSIFIFWYLLVPLLVWWIWSRPKTVPRPRHCYVAPAVCLLVAVAVALPWWIRNCVVLDRLMPLGSQGAINLPAAYGEQAVANMGVWKPMDFSEFYDEHRGQTLSPIDEEREMAVHGLRKALRWIAANPLKVPLLISYKLRDLWKPEDALHALIIFFAAVGTAAALQKSAGPPRAVTVTLLSLLLFNSISVAMTYSAGWRLMVPVELLLDVLASIGLWRTGLLTIHVSRLAFMNGNERSRP